jgi:hypothetical protein
MQWVFLLFEEAGLQAKEAGWQESAVKCYYHFIASESSFYRPRARQAREEVFILPRRGQGIGARPLKVFFSFYRPRARLLGERFSFYRLGGRALEHAPFRVVFHFIAPELFGKRFSFYRLRRSCSGTGFHFIASDALAWEEVFILSPRAKGIGARPLKDCFSFYRPPAGLLGKRFSFRRPRRSCLKRGFHFLA